MPNFDPQEGQLRYGFHPAGEEDRWAPIPDPAFVQCRINQENLAFDLAQIASDALAPGGQAVDSVAGKRRPQGNSITVDLEPHGHSLFLGQFQRNAATPVVLDTGAFRHTLGPGQSDVALFGRRLQMQVARDDDRVMKLYAAGVGGFSFATAADGKLAGNIDIVGSRLDYLDDPVQTSGTSTDPFIRGLPSLTDQEAGADSNLSVEVVAVPGTGGADFNIAVYRDSAGTAGATVVPITVGTWTRLRDSNDGNFYGNPPSYVEIYWPDATGVIVGDIWTVDQELATPWARSLPAVQMLPETETDVYIDGEVVGASAPFTGLTIAGSHNAEINAGIGGTWGAGVILSGKRAMTAQIDRRMVSNYYVRRLEAGHFIHLDVIAQTQIAIAGTAFNYRARFIAPNARLNGRRPTITDPTTMTESYNLELKQAATPDAEGFSDDLTIILDNALASLV